MCKINTEDGKKVMDVFRARSLEIGGLGSIFNKFCEMDRKEDELIGLR